MNVLYRNRILSLFLLIILVSCDKKEKEDPVPQTTPETTQTDQEGTSAIDDAIDNVNDVISNKIGNGHTMANSRVAAYNLPCGIVKLDSSMVNGRLKYTLQYGEATSCGYKKKSGSVSFALINGNTFADTGAVYSVTFTDYKVEVLALSKDVTVNGTITITNVDGHYIWETIVFSNRTIKHKIRGALHITYSNGEIRERNHYQVRTWVSTGGWAGLSFNVSGDTLDNISETGYTIDGNRYYQTHILEPLKWENCGESYTGPYVLKTGHAKMDISFDNVSDAYIDVEAGYNWDITEPAITPEKVNDCTSNAYKVYAKFGSLESTEYELY